MRRLGCRSQHPTRPLTGSWVRSASVLSSAGTGAAAAEALTDIFGIQYTLTDRCHENRTEFEGKPRLFYSFYDMAEENAISRVPLGVHYRMDCEAGVDLGYRCGRRVNAMDWKK